MSQWQPFREPLRRTLTRTLGIAAVAGGILALARGGLAHWPAATVVMLWPSLGGHWVELWFLNWLRPRLSRGRAAQVAARLAVWFVGGVALGVGMWLTAAALPGLRPPRPSVWWAGLGFVGVELVAQTGLQLRGRPSFFNGRG
jgi:hypothetical protein